jgi:ABC-type molybdate transport system substrate-binding protein
LKYSKNPEIAKKFSELAASEKGRAIFGKYGLYDVK